MYKKNFTTREEAYCYLVRILPRARNKLTVLGNYSRAASKLAHKDVIVTPIVGNTKSEQFMAIPFDERGDVAANVIRFSDNRFHI